MRDAVSLPRQTARCIVQLQTILLAFLINLSCTCIVKFYIMAIGLEVKLNRSAYFHQAHHIYHLKFQSWDIHN